MTGEQHALADGVAVAGTGLALLADPSGLGLLVWLAVVLVGAARVVDALTTLVQAVARLRSARREQG